MSTRWTPEAIRGLGVVTDIVTAGEILEIGRTTSFNLARSGNFPVPVLKIGNQYRVPTAPLLALLGLTPDMDERGSDNPRHATGTDDGRPRRDGSTLHPVA